MTWAEFSRTRIFVKYINPALLFLWYVLLIFIAWQTMVLLRQYPINIDVVNIALPNIISTIGIISAILITFVFSKLYSEKSEIVERKKRMQELSAKLNSIRKIIYILFKKNKFCKTQETVLDDFIADIDDDYIVYNRFNQKRYTQKDLLEIWGEIPSLVSFMDNKPEEFKDIKELPVDDQKTIADNLKVINENDGSMILDNKTVSNTFLDYMQLFLEEHYVLLVLNSNKARRNFYLLMFDLLVFVMLIITGLIFLNISVSYSTTLFVNQLIVSIFIASVIDILKNIFQAVQFEFKAYGIRET